MCKNMYFYTVSIKWSWMRFSTFTSTFLLISDFFFFSEKCPFYLLLMFTFLFQIMHFMPLLCCLFQPPLLCWVLHTGPISPLFSRPFCLCLCVLKAAQSSCTPTPQLTIWSFWEPLNQVGCAICIRWWLREKYEDPLGSTFHSDWPTGNKQTNHRKEVYSAFFISALFRAKASIGS